jgi:DNA-binding response OmpR family regulator
VCILVVEDEFLIRLIVAEELAEGGFEVCEAEDGDQAARLIQDPPAMFSLLITDIHMPGRLDGIEVARRMRARHPRVPIIYTTGRPDALHAVGPLGRNDALVPKPYAPSDLLTVARRLLADSGKDRGR